ncbi:TPR repeat-containing protein [Nostoc sp. DSM 114160]|jgi:tetratricopeptide (TPR) repeat protein
MSLPVTVTFMLTDWIAKGLADGTFERVGGVIRDVATKQVVSWLREQESNNYEVPTSPPSANNLLNLIFSGTNLVASGANAAVTGKGLANINGRLGSIENQIGQIGQSLQLTQGILQVTTAASVLNLGVSVMGFAVIAQRLKELEQRLKQAEELLKKVNRKIDLSFYANFRAAIELAINAFTMTKPENRRSSALQAINRFIEAEHIYTDYADIEIEQKSQIADEYLLTLSLAYLAEARCYLELEEHDTALRRFQEGSRVIRSRILEYVKLLLTSNPAVYLQPQFKGQIDLRRLTRIYQWLDQTLDENAVFDMQRINLFMLAQDPNNAKWVESIPAAIWDSKVDWVGKAFWDDPKPLIYARLPKTLEIVESMIETNRRFESYQTELQAISQLKISFHDWLKLTPSTEIKPDGAELMYIIPSKPLELQSSI